MATMMRTDPKAQATRQAVDRYVQAAKTEGCPKDQVENFLRYGIVLQPRQLRACSNARLCDHDGGPTKVGFGGARGGGKSHWMLSQMAEDCLRYAGLSCLLLRKVGKSLKEGFEKLIRKALSGVPYKYVPTRNLLVFENGSQIVLGHFQKESDVDTYLGLEYDVIGIEEATTLTSSKHTAVASCNRTSSPGWRPRMYYTTNPGGIGHAWFKALFIAAWKSLTETATRFIPSTARDNRFLNREYHDFLDNLTGWLKKAWRDGDWDIAAGQFFTTWRSDYHVIKPFDVRGAQYQKWGGFDYGWTHYTTFLTIAKDGEGNLYVTGEYGARKTQIPRHADAIKAHVLRVCGIDMDRKGHGFRIAAGHDAFNSRDEGPTIAAQYEEQGVILHRAMIDRKNGAGEILGRLGDMDATDLTGNPKPIKPRLFVFDTCRHLIETLPALEHNPHDPEDTLKVDCDEEGLGGDDWYDDFRYAVMEDYKKYVPGAPSSSGTMQHLDTPIFARLPGAPIINGGRLY